MPSSRGHAPGDYVFLWSQPLGSYFLSERRPASRFLYDMPLIDTYGNVRGASFATPKLKVQLMSDLARNTPRLIVVEGRDAALMSLVPGLVRLIERDYVPVIRLSSAPRLGGYTVYARNGRSSPLG